MIIKGQGILRHRFWGEYSAALAIQWRDSHEASAALASGILGPGWTLGATRADVTVTTVDSAGLDALVDRLVAIGAERSAIASLAHSVDYGDPWDVEADVVDPRQGAFFDDGEV